ncbi:hypothetical protein RND81_03G034900 [Saponaria officinalis]
MLEIGRVWGGVLWILLICRVIPKSLVCKEITGETVGEVKTVSNMHQRKAEMARQADAFIALPGGYGTLEELLEVITYAQLGIHRKPVGLLNVDGYYNCLLSFIDKAVDEGFISPTSRGIIVSAPKAKELFRKLEVVAVDTSFKLLHGCYYVVVATVLLRFLTMRVTRNCRWLLFFSGCCYVACTAVWPLPQRCYCFSVHNWYALAR